MMRRCSVCSREFTRRDNLDRHMRTHTGEKPFACSQPACGKRFVQETHLKKHERTHNIFNGSASRTNTKNSTTNKISSTGIPFNSHNSAPIGFRSSAASLAASGFGMNSGPINFRTTTNHHPTHPHAPPGSSILAVYRPIPVSAGGMDFPPMIPGGGGNGVNVGNGSTGSGSSGCSSSSEGGKALSPATYLRNFCMGMSEEKFVCTVCGGTFKRRDNLERHMRAHTGEKPFGCTLCSKRFAQAAHVNKHMRAHDSDKYYPCTVCGKYFTRRDNLDRHWRIHTGEKPFNCTVCGRFFSQKEHLQKHSRSHQNQINMNQLKLEDRNQYLAL